MARVNVYMDSTCTTERSGAPHTSGWISVHCVNGCSLMIRSNLSNILQQLLALARAVPIYRSASKFI